MERDNWFFSIAEKVGDYSKCLSRKIGVIAVKDNKYIIATGYNGPPSKYPPCISSTNTCPRYEKRYKTGEGTEICPAEHAERNVINEAARLGIRLEGTTLFMDCGIPCRECSKAIVNSGIKEIVCINGDIYPEPGLSGMDILSKCGIKIRIRK